MNDFIYYNGKIYKFGIVPIKGKDFTFKGTYTENYHYEKNDFIQHDFSLYCAKEDFTATTFENDLQSGLLELAVRNTLQTITFSTAFTNDSNEEDINANLVRDGGSVIEPNYKVNFINFDLLSRKANTARYIDLEMDNNTYRITAKLKNDKGEVIATSNVIDLPSESTVVNAKVSDDGNNLILSLRNGQETSISLGKMLSNLQQKITSDNKLPSDLVSDESQANKFVTEQEKTDIANNTNARHTHSNKTTIDKITENHLKRISKAVQEEDFEDAMADVYKAKQDKFDETVNCEIRTEEIKDENDNVVDERTVLEVGSYNKDTNPNGFVRMSDILNEINKLKQELVPEIGTILFFNDNTFNPNNKWVDTTWERITNNRYLRIAENVENEQLIGGSNTHNHSAGELVACVNYDWINSANRLFLKRKETKTWKSDLRTRSDASYEGSSTTYNIGTEVMGDTDNAIVEPIYQKVFAWKRIA